METTRTRLRKAVDDETVEPLNDALKSGQTAYQGLLKLRARDHRLQQGQQSGAGAGGGSSASQQQMEQLELTDRQNRYEQQRAAESQAPTSQRAEELAILDRLKDLARRQEGLTERLKEVEAQLRTAKTEPERQELLEELKRLRDEQQRLLQDADRLRTRINQSQPSEQVEQTREQLEQTRRQMVDSTEALREGRLSQAINSISCRTTSAASRPLVSPKRCVKCAARLAT
jgi:DNA repair exonuclease SbcCD ATPase subunit